MPLLKQHCLSHARVAPDAEFDEQGLKKFLRRITKTTNTDKLNNMILDIYAGTGIKEGDFVPWPSLLDWAFQAKMSGVRRYNGFMEYARRMLFAYEDHFPDAQPHLLTVLPTGAIENDKILEPKPEKGLITFTYPQTMKDEDVKSTLLDTPFVWERDDGSYAVVQTWSTNCNAEFKKSFEMTTSLPKDFSQQAAEEFRRCVTQLFGAGSRTQPIMFCKKTTQNQFPAYVGMPESLMELLHRDANVREELRILKVGEDEKGRNPFAFVTTVVDGKGEESYKSFEMEPRLEYVMYVKQGWQTMGCVKPLEQFLAEADFHGVPREIVI
eukprot:TRINITY_DN43651_c0_g3_i1.p1 TRINITY_DN43651_c0_g3~~TRINITY_DN43651_c0_g3_i1.p1  ORF type:complete len:325 (-),score=72.96 TRINITY_DN43651_c0_g3_i1:353-1327(-)